MTSATGLPLGEKAVDVHRHYLGDVDRGEQSVTVDSLVRLRCVISGCAYDFEFDHRRALLNGGDSELTNLATLRHECHTAKTQMDTILLRRGDRLRGYSVTISLSGYASTQNPAFLSDCKTVLIQKPIQNRGKS